MDQELNDNEDIWSRVEQTSDASAFVGYLDTLYGMEAYTAFKQRTFTLLEIREGYHILDVGCGTGEDVRSLVTKVGPVGRIVGIDNSATMIAQAQERTQGTNQPVEYYVCDAHHLPFPDNSFDGCRADLTFQHLDNPEAALTEMIRVARSGASIVIADPDGETQVVDMPDRSLTRKILNYQCDRRSNGWMGRQLPGIFKRVGLRNIRIVPETFIQTNYEMADQIFGFWITVQRAQQSGVTTIREGTYWLTYLKNLSSAGYFFSAGTIFIVGGKKP